MNWPRHIYGHRRRTGSWMSKYYDMTALTHLQSLGFGCQAWTSSSMGFGAIQILLNEVFIHSIESVVKFDGGISTIYIAKVLSNKGGKFLTVEQNHLWLSKIEKMIGKLSLRPGTWHGVH